MITRTEAPDDAAARLHDRTVPDHLDGRPAGRPDDPRELRQPSPARGEVPISAPDPERRQDPAARARCHAIALDLENRVGLEHAVEVSRTCAMHATLEPALWRAVNTLLERRADTVSAGREDR